MARHVRVPGLVDIVLVTEPAEIRALASEPRIDRRFTARGPLLNRFIARRIRRWFHIAGELLPSLTPRDDMVRADQQRQLAATLPPAHGKPPCSDAELEQLAAFVRGGGSRDAAAVVVQRVVGKQFHADYEADQASWRASELIDRFRDGFSPAQIVWKLTGRPPPRPQAAHRSRTRRSMGHARQCHRYARGLARVRAHARSAVIFGGAFVG